MSIHGPSHVQPGSGGLRLVKGRTNAGTGLLDYLSTASSIRLLSASF
jgi:hypothetical protein